MDKVFFASLFSTYLYVDNITFKKSSQFFKKHIKIFKQLTIIK